MGLAAGGRMKQKIYPDPHGLDVWDPAARSRAYVHIVNSELWREITGEAAPPTPVSAKSYTQAGLPWFELYDEHAPALDPTAALGGVKSIKELDDEPVPTPNVKRLWWKHQGTVAVDDGDW
jgi:hypothetical protein